MPSDRLLVELRRRLNFEALFTEFMELRGSGNERTARCLWHEDSVPSMSVNVEEGLYFCHNPECGARGDFIDFYRRVRSLTFTEALTELARRAGLDPSEYRGSSTPRAAAPTPEDEERVLAGYRPSASPEPRGPQPIDEAVVQSAHERLLATEAKLEWLNQRRGLTVETVREYQLGHDGRRYYVPVRDESGACVNIRQYAPEARGASKMISWRSGYGQARLFPLQAFEEADRDVLLVEGEMDCLLARQMGLNAVTTTGGAGTWREQWNGLFRDRDVVICYDADEAGQVGSRHIAGHLFDVARSVKVVRIPLTEPEGADFTDYVVGHGHSVVDFLRIVSQTPTFTRDEATAAVERAPEREPTHLHLSQASRSEHYNAPVRFNVMVSGKTTSPYLVPRQVRMTCSMPGLPMCERCPVGNAAGSLARELQFESNEVLQYTDVPEDRMLKLLKEKVRIPSRCRYVQPQVIEALNIERVQLIPEIERTEEEAPYVTREAFYLGHGLQSNRSYLMTGLTVPEPKRQIATHVIHTAIPSQSNIDAFQLTPDVVRRLSVFRPQEPGVDGLWRQLGRMYDDLERVLRIYQRRDLLLAVDLTYHSLLSFELQGERLQRGWMECLVIGDSRTGKTTVVQRMVQHYGAGEFGTGENTTLAGLIGGLHQIGTSWALQWGRIPLNDRRLFVIDEAGNLPIDQIARMSAMRSSGIAEVIKVHTERTNARTRQIWISNPRMPQPLSAFSQGVLAVKQLVGAPEDIARFDLVVTASTNDVELAVINTDREQERPDTFTAELCHQRVMWAWSRTADKVRWAPGALASLLRRATEQGQKYRYAAEIPLVEPNEQRVKLARMAVATAALFFSTDETGEMIVVQPEHVEFSWQFLERLYAKPTLAFDEYAAMQRRRYEISDDAEVRRIVTARAGALQSLMEQEQFTQRDLAEILGVDDRGELRESVATLRDSGFLRRQGSSFYLKTPAAIRWLRQEISRLARADDEREMALRGSRNGDGNDDEGREPPF